MSQIDKILTAIGELSVSGLTQTPVVFPISEATESVKGTPARVVFPLPLGDSEGREISHVSLGRTMVVSWQIADLMLWASAKNGTLHDATPELIAYSKSYINVIQDNKNLSLSQVKIEEITLEWGEFEYPPGGGKKNPNRYHGCLVMLTVKEIVE